MTSSTCLPSQSNNFTSYRQLLRLPQVCRQVFVVEKQEFEPLEHKAGAERYVISPFELRGISWTVEHRIVDCRQDLLIGRVSVKLAIPFRHHGDIFWFSRPSPRDTGVSIVQG